MNKIVFTNGAVLKWDTIPTSPIIGYGWKHFDYVKDLSKESQNSEDLSGQRQETPESK